MSFDSITNRAEYFSDHYLDAVIGADLTALRKLWAEREERAEQTSRSGLIAAGPKLTAALSAHAEGDADADHRANTTIAEALGFEVRPAGLTRNRGAEIEVELPVLAAGGDVLLIEVAVAPTAELALSDGVDQARGGLLNPVLIDGEPEHAPAQALSLIFELNQPPRHVLLLAGRFVLLATRGKWNEGRWLAADLGLASERSDTKAKGELETIAALFGRESLLPADAAEGKAFIDRFEEASHRNAVGVSEDLREGVRFAVEEIANEVIARRKDKKLAATGEQFARDLAKQSLRYMYRILFLLYAEAKPDLEVVPGLAEGYQAGYGLDRLRELVVEEIQDERSREGTHLYDSLQRLFDLVNDGHRHNGTQLQGTLGAAAADGDDTGFIFQPLDSDLFSPDATQLIDSAGLRNEPLRRVLARLLLTAEGGKGDRRFISYSALGINQLGAVYERLMAYSGFLADQDLYEICELASNGKPKEGGGRWVIPTARADEFPEECFVTTLDPDTGERRRVLHRKDSFVYRLSGRQRQRSASYYTPEVLTEFVVRHALEELLDRDGEKTPAEEMLRLTVCEPALGSGAFLNEAINQLAMRYLARRQEELGELIEPERYPIELQKAKAHFALHQAYGVDLNDSAVELAEVSLWLNAMHPGLRAPWFGLHLRRGNSLVGARRQTYRPEQLAKRAWLKAAPKDRPLSEGSILSGEIHHFLLPADGWGAAGGTKEAKELAPGAAKTLREWAKDMMAGPKKSDAARLAALARRVETLWELSVLRLGQGEAALRRDLDVFGSGAAKASVDAAGSEDVKTRRLVEAALEDESSALVRLRVAMNAWCGLWFWSVQAQEAPPGWTEWLEVLEALLGVDAEGAGATMPRELSFDNLSQLDALEERLAEGVSMASLDEIKDRHPWVAQTERLAAAEGFFHWELEFAHVMRRGGFDLQVGNPPWVRLDWMDDRVLADQDPWFGVSAQPTSQVVRRREAILESPAAAATYLTQRSAAEGLTTFLASPPLFPDLTGIRTNLYMVFMVQTWRNQQPGGAVGMLHPEGHFSEPKGGSLRKATYPRLRRHWHFVNEARLFDEVHHETDFGVHVYGARSGIGFRMVANAQLPATVDGSLELAKNGASGGELPGIKTVNGRWDQRPHPDRLLDIDSDVLASWAGLFDEPGTPAGQARLMRPHTTADLKALESLAANDERLGGRKYWWTSGWNEKNAKTDGIIERLTEIPPLWEEVVLQGPHFTVANPFAKQPNENCKNNLDWSEWDLESLPEHAIPRTNYQRACSRERYEAEMPHWDGEKADQRFRLIYRRFVSSSMSRTLHAALIPPGPLHVHVNHTVLLPSAFDVVMLAGLWSGLPSDYLLKTSGQANFNDELARKFPLPSNGHAADALVSRALLLNCLTSDYAPLFEELRFVTRGDAWTSDDGRLGPFRKSTEWSTQTPLRLGLERRQALVEIDALTALVLGLTADQLCAMYRTQFGVLRKYEWKMRHDANGREVPADVLKAYEKDGEGADLGRYVLPFTRPDREAEMRRAYAEFERRYGR